MTVTVTVRRPIFLNLYYQPLLYQPRPVCRNSEPRVSSYRAHSSHRGAVLSGTPLHAFSEAFNTNLLAILLM